MLGDRPIVEGQDGVVADGLLPKELVEEGLFAFVEKRDLPACGQLTQGMVGEKDRRGFLPLGRVLYVGDF